MSRHHGTTIAGVMNQFSFGGSLVDDDSSDLAPAGGSYYRRGPDDLADPNSFWTLWPKSTMLNGDPTVPLKPQERNPSYARWQITGGGNQTQNFIMGTVKDADGNPVAGAVVQGYLSSTKAYVGQAISLSDGTYQLGTPYGNAVAHYLVAYLSGSPDTAGTTVNTLTPTNADGS